MVGGIWPLIQCTDWRWGEYSHPHSHSRIILGNFIFALVFASADAADKSIDILIRTLSDINIRIRIRTIYAETDARIIEYLVILVYTIQNASDILQKKQKSYYLKKKLPILNFKY